MSYAGKCSKVSTPHGCGHTTITYGFCNMGRHLNEYYANKACHEAPGLSPPATIHSGQTPFCGPTCRAKGEGWLCCQCPLVNNNGSSSLGMSKGIKSCIIPTHLQMGNNIRSAHIAPFLVCRPK